MSKITFASFELFIKGCAALVREGVIFDADGDTWTVMLTGGY
jgi:hypothetical protein